MSSQQLWLPEEDVYEDKPVNTLMQGGRTHESPSLAEKFLAVNGSGCGRESYFFIGMVHATMDFGG